MDTPRGRIVLMKQVLEGTLEWRAAQPHIDRCLGCLGCEPACPSGVPYRDLISPFRAVAQPHFSYSTSQKLRRTLASQILPFPNRLRFAARLAPLGKRLSSLLPKTIRPMFDLLPNALPPAPQVPAVTPAQGERRARVALLLGCAQQVLAPDINAATVAVLALNGVEVVVPTAQCCCGGLAWHTGQLASARAFARQNLRAFPADVDAIISNAAGCGSALREYHLILRGTGEEREATVFRNRVMDIHSFLARIGLRSPPRGLGRPMHIAYQDACHLANGQNVRQQPRSLLGAIPGVTVCELSDGDICCGSAGTYNLDQPELAAALGAKKAKAVMASGADLVATGNIGCLVQLQAHLRRLGSELRVRHTMQILRDSYGIPSLP
jgi:glycolate oxidase iron-sulfur subunit